MNGKKLLALLLTVFMIISMMPLGVFAAETEAQAQTEQTTNPHVEPQLTSDKVVYVSNDAGDDSYSGLTPDEPVFTLTHAAELLGAEGGTIVICGNVAIANEPLATYEYTKNGVTETLPDGRFQLPAHEGLIYITSVYDGVDYISDCSAALAMSNWNEMGATKGAHFILNGPTTFEYVHFAAETNPVFYGRGHFITMGEGITQDYPLLVVGYDTATNLSKVADRATTTDTHIILKSGNYHTVSGMTRQTTDGVYMGTAYVTFGENVGTVSTFTGLGELVNGGYYGNAVIEVNGGTFGIFAGAAHNATNADFGDVTITVNNYTFASNGRFDCMARGGSDCKYGDVKTVINAGTFNTIEGYAFGATNSVFGNSDLTINGGSFAYINGVTMTDGNVSTGIVVADATTTFNAGTVSNHLCGGSFRNGFTADSVTLNVNGGTFAKTVTGLNMTGDVVVNDTIALNITAGTFKEYVCAASYGNNTTYTTTVTGGADLFVNVSGGDLQKPGASLMVAYKCTSNLILGRTYYNISGGNIDKIYVGTRSTPAVKGAGTFFTYSGGNVKTISTAWNTDTQKYYFVGDKTFENTNLEGGGSAGYPKPGEAKCNIVNIGSEYPDAVYVSDANGSYANDGLTPETPIKSIYDAAMLLGPDGGTIYLMADINGVYTPRNAGPLTISTILPGETEPSGVMINLDNANMYLESDMTFDGVTFRSTKAERLIAFQGHNVTITENCRTIYTDEETGNTGSICLIMGYSQNGDTYAEGGRTATQISVYNDQTVNINGGEWASLYGGNRRFGQSSSIGTYYGDVVINVGEGATFTNNTPADDAYPSNALYLTGSNIIKGNVTANLAGTFNTPVYGVGKLGVYYNGVSTTFNGKTVAFLSTDGIAMRDDTKFEGNVTINATGTFNGNITAICAPGDTPLYGDFTLNTEGGTFADGFKSDAKGVMGTTTYVGEDLATVNYDTANGVANKNSDPIRVITVGDSITWGSAAKASTVDGYEYHLYNNNYPTNLQKLLGEGAVVGNFGYPGARARHAVYNDYFGSSSYGLSMQFGDADAVIIALGTNESRSIAEGGNPEHYETAMRELIEGYHAAYPNAVIYITTALPRFGAQANTDAVEQVVMPIQIKLAEEYEYTKLMDLYTDMLPYAKIDIADNTAIYFADKLHPTNLGYSIMAAAVAEDIKADFHYYAYEHKDATCTEIGCDHYGCIWCDAAYTENEVDALGHNFVETDRVDATYDADGYVDYECDRCGATTRETLPILGKTYTEFEVFAPTCTEQGYTRHYCDQDDTYYDDTYVPALGHAEQTATVAPDCTNTGSITTTCTRCDYVNVETIPALGHTAGDEATCTKDQICTVCRDVLVPAHGHDTTSTVVAPTATAAGYTLTTCAHGDLTTKTNWVDATEGIVVFVDTNASAGGDGSIDAPFNLYTTAFTYADVSFDRTIVLMSMVKLTANYTERAHTGHYTVTSVYDGVDYAGGFNVTGGYHYVLSGATTFENVDFTLASTLVFRCRFNPIVMGEGINFTDGKNVYVVGADQDSNSTCDPSQDVSITLLSGKYYEVIGGWRSGGSANITGTINIYVGGTANVYTIFAGNRSLGGKYITDANVTLDGGIVEVFVTASDVSATTAATGAPKGTVTINVTENFDVSQSFTVTSGVHGFVISSAYSGAAADVLAASGYYVLNIDAAVYDEIIASGMIDENSVHEINRIGEPVEGDFDGDGELTNADITVLVRYLAGWDVDGVVDVTADEKINNRDAIYLVQKLAGWFDEE